ncbi:EAL domain-containing protein [Candidatus Methylospira mobilis]|uniref:EAL domain-containing protein n=1 Tax=Candidatus Methylospira mobilis TaxID=1808979 RepID=A0A5Q0BLG5_9GAMM|nr:EAL domain-containing protein [Candidatus Methylospira mobilis]QFY42937.1 EAL domain-containing protein [Candidatus Methylospira mobilis]WNV03824.1 EAL domain-containing protein [Candidatus Methylospira mobilis]
MARRNEAAADLHLIESMNITGLKAQIRLPALWIIVAGSYLAMAKICLELGAIGGTISPFWLPAGLVMGLTLALGYRVLPGIFIGQLLSGVLLETHTGWLAPFAEAGGNILEGIIFRYLAAGRPITTVRSFLNVLPGAALGSLANAAIGVSAFTWSGAINPDIALQAALTWFIGDIGGALIIMPVIAGWKIINWNVWKKTRFLAEFGFLSLLTVTLSYIAFFDTFSLPSYPLVFLLLPLLLWGAFRFDYSAVNLLNAILTGVAVAGTTHGHGPFAIAAPIMSLTLLQIFTAALVCTSLLVMLINRERRNVMIDIRQQAIELEHRVQKQTGAYRAANWELRESEKRFRFMLETSPISVRITSTDGRKILFANRRYEELINVSAGRAIGINPTTFYKNPDDYESVLKILKARENIFNRLTELSVPGAGTKWVLASYLSIRYQGKSEFLGWFYDITEHKQAEEKLTLSDRVFNETHEGIIITDVQNRIIDVNPAFCTITGYTRDEAIGQTPHFLRSGKQPPEFYTALWGTLNETGHWQGELWNRKKNGDLYAERLTISALRDDHGIVLHYVALFSDITQTKQQQQALELMAHYDALTQLPNRVLFAKHFNQAISYSRRESALLAVCYLDLDGFKQVNDSLGHDAGDQLLIEVANRIQSSLRGEDTLSRLGGDEFALLINDLQSFDECEQVLVRIHQAIAQPYLIGGQAVNVAASTGVTLYPRDDADPDTLLRHADQAMYLAKTSGRNRYCLFDSEQAQQMQRQSRQLEQIEAAFVRKEFCLFYQPKVNMSSGEVVGMEALIRWNHPERGIVAPAAFLPAVEGSAFEIVLGNWVIDTALAQLDSWRGIGLEIEVSVNIAPRHLQDPDFFITLHALLAQHPVIPARRLQLEVVESSVLNDLGRVSEVIALCRRELGVGFALDDFGTGYSSLTYLRRLPVDSVKIDQSFVRDMIDDPEDHAIVNGVIALARAFKREVVAEGVETCEHGMVLLDMGCDLAQGYGIARPMPADAVASWVRDYRPDEVWRKAPVS